MGYVTNRVVIVTVSGYQLESVQGKVEAFVADMAEEYRHLVIGPIKSVVNDAYQYIFASDGSKDGWDTAIEADEYRDRFEELFDFAYSDHSSPFQVVRVEVGEGVYRRKFVDHQFQSYEYEQVEEELDKLAQVD